MTRLLLLDPLHKPVRSLWTFACFFFACERCPWCNRVRRRRRRKRQSCSLRPQGVGWLQTHGGVFHHGRRLPPPQAVVANRPSRRWLPGRQGRCWHGFLRAVWFGEAFFSLYGTRLNKKLIHRLNLLMLYFAWNYFKSVSWDFNKLSGRCSSVFAGLLLLLFCFV